MALSNGSNVGILAHGAEGDYHYPELMNAWRWTNLFLQPVVKDVVAAVPTSGQADGDAYIVTGSTNQNKLARWTDKLDTPAWEYLTPKTGWEVRVLSKLDSAKLPKIYAFDGTNWIEKSSGGGKYIPMPITSVSTAGGYTLLDTDKNAFLQVTVAKGANMPITLPADVAWKGVEVLVQNVRGCNLQFNNGSIAVPVGKKTTCNIAGAVVRLKCLDEASWSLTGELDIDIENSAPQPSYVNTFGSDRTIALSDVGDTLLMNSNTATSLTVTVPPESSVAFPNSAEINVIQFGTSPVLIAAGSGVNLYKPAGYNAKAAKQYAALTLKRVAADSWVIAGMLEPTS